MITQELSHIRDARDTIATGYDRYVTPTDNWSLPKHALKLAGLRPGMRFLDVASGSGALSLPAARLGADVTAVDISPVMIGRLGERAREEGLSNIETRVMDGHALELEDNTFDVSGSQFGIMLFPDLPRAARELVRVTKPQGRVFLVAFANPSKVEFLGTFVGAIQKVVPEFTSLPMDPLPLPFQVSDPQILRRRMEEAGLRDIRIEPGVERLPFRSGNEMWDWVTNSNPIAVQMISDLTDEQKSRVRQSLDEILQKKIDGNGAAVLKAEVNIGIGTR
jgi:ubiquinone/menaquinone biosynthesis C-methylase UbiE